MVAFAYAETENGDRIDDPSEDALFLLIDGLEHPDNTFVTIAPADDDPAWYAVVALLDDGGYETVLRDARFGEHAVTLENGIDRVAQDVTIWLAGRPQPRRPERPPNADS